MKPRSYGPFPYSAIVRRPKLTWPNGARVALWVIPNIEFFALDEKIPSSGSNNVPDIMVWSPRDYGNRVGVFRLMQVMDRYGIRATVALNSNICAHHPEIIEEGCARNWEWMGHNQTNTVRLNAVPPEQELGIIQAALSTIGQASGTRPVGWLGSGLQESWNSLEHLAAEGVEYISDWVNDDQPYIMNLENGGTMVAMNYSQEINDKPAYDNHHFTSDEFSAMIKRQFDVLYREGAESGRVMGIALHPYLSGVPHRIDALDKAFEHICKHEDVWLATGAEITRAFLTTEFAQEQRERPPRTNRPK